MEDLISVIVPIFNNEEYLMECIESIVNQSYKHLEIILINDGSTDGSKKICDEYAQRDSRIKIIHKGNEGVSKTRNLGIDMATGKWITFIDADDYIETDFIEKAMKYALEEKCDVVITGYRRLRGEKEETICKEESYKLNGREYLLKALSPQEGIGFSAMKLIKKSIIKDIKFDSRLRVGEDALFNTMLSENIERAYYLNKDLYIYRVNQVSVVKRYDKDYANKYLQSMQINKEYITNKFRNDKEVIQKLNNFIAFHVLLIAVNYSFSFNNKEKHKIKAFKEICNIPEFKEGISRSNYDNISFTRRVALFSIKHKLYATMALISIVRQIQNKD